MPAKVSVIIPCYNCGKTVEESFASLEKQTFKDFDVIFVNDGSTDNTLEVLKKMQEKNTLAVHIIDKPNGGVSSARNFGIDSADGEYILFLDADDGYHREYIERMVTAAEESGADTVYCRLSRVQKQVENAESPREKYVSKTKTQMMDDLLYRMGEFGCYCYIYKKAVLDKIALRFVPNTAFGEDREFNWKYLCHCESAVFIDMPLYFYRINENSATRRKASWKKTDLLTAIKRTEEYLKEQNCPYAEEFNSYMYARAMWAVAKTFAVSRDKNLFKRLTDEYDVKTCMRRTAEDKNKLVAFASKLYLINPMLFYFTVGLR